MAVSAPVIADGVLYATGPDGLHALDAASGTSLWTFDPPVQGFSASMPVVANGIVYFTITVPAPPGHDCKGAVYATDAATGSLLWKTRTGCSFSRSVTVGQGLLVAGFGFDVDAFSPSTGGLLWSFPTGGSIESPPAVSGGMVFVASDDGNLYAVNASTGLQVWENPLPAGSSSPAVAKGVVYICRTDSGLSAIDAATGSLLWTFAPGIPAFSSPSIGAGLVYFGAANGYVYAVRTSDGTMRWKFATGFENVGAYDPAGANGVIYVGSDGGASYALNSSTGEPLWSFATPFALPAVANGNVYATSVDPFDTPIVYDFGL